MESSTELLTRHVGEVMESVIALRRHLHQHPELSGAEVNTARLLNKRLRDEGLAVQTDIGGHGLVARIESGRERAWVALRGDMDALPMDDAKKRPYSSQTAGVAHACGHDAHTAMLYGTAVVLHRLRDRLPANVACVFQPAEETTEGAAAMLADGLFTELKPTRIHALHVYPYLPAGTIGLRDGIMCAAADLFQVELLGRGGHAARPHECVDVILIASQIIQALHHIVSRRVDPMHPAVLTIGQIEGGHAANVIPGSVCFSGTVRSLNSRAHEEIRTRMDRIIRQTAEIWGAEAHFHMKRAIPPLINDEAVMRLVRRQLAHYAPHIPCIEIEEASMGGEDFSEFLQHVPGCLLRLGTGGGPDTRYPLHHPCFDVDESALEKGVLTLASLCLRVPD
ncbi:MAG: amidohydrolase [Mariprofundaceae bacterium]